MKADILSGDSDSASPFNRSIQHDAKRIAILSQAARLFNYKGSRATTLHDIAEQSRFNQNQPVLLCQKQRRPDLSVLHGELWSFT